MPNKIAQQLNRLDLSISDDDFWEKPETIIVIGGDGSLLGAARHTVRSQVPLLGINMGKLGFLAETEQNEVHEAIEHLITNNYSIQKRMMMDCFIDEKHAGTVLNDVVLSRHSIARMISIDVAVNEEHIDTYRADGIIIATPTGSTAYSLSAGGPVLGPELDCFLLTPICPHSLSARSIVLNSNNTVRLNVKVAEPDTVLTLDGQKTIRITTNNSIIIKKSKLYSNFIKYKKNHFFSTLKQSLSNN